MLILNLFKESVEFNLSKLLPAISVKPVKGPAFSMARYKIKLIFFIKLNNLLIEHIQSLKPKLWNGYRLIVGDGTTVNLPPSRSIKKHFGIFTQTKKGTKTCIANACMLYDVLSNYILDSLIAPSSIGEGTMINKMISNHKSNNSIILLDRGFGYFYMCKTILTNNLDFCIRIKASQSDFAKEALLNPLFDFVTVWTASKAARETCITNKLDCNDIKVRVTKVLLQSGELEILVSSLLDVESIKEKQMKELYNLRWGIEEGYKKLKPKMKLEQFGCRRYEGIYQEFYSHIFMMNLVEIIGAEAEEKIKKKTEKRKIKYKFNWQNAFRHLKDKFIDIFHLGMFERSLEYLIEKIADSLIAIKENRTFERKKGKDKLRYTQTYK